MILPTKGVQTDRALLTIGAEILEALEEPKTVSALWHVVRERRKRFKDAPPLTFDWFVLALDLLYMLGAIRRGEFNTLRRAEP